MAETQDAAMSASRALFDAGFLQSGKMSRTAEIIRRECGLDGIVALLRNCRGHIAVGWEPPGREQLELMDRIDAALAKLGTKRETTNG